MTNKQQAAGSTHGTSNQDDAKRIQDKQGGHHLPPHDDDGPALDDTDRNTDKIIKPSRIHRE